MLKIEYWSISQKGKKHEKNEDNSLSLSRNNIFNTALFMICDGVGGYAGGDIASKMIVTKFEKIFSNLRDNYENIEEYLRQILTQINNDILEYSRQNPNYPRLSSTVVGLLTIDNSYHVFSVGDSRVYLRDKIGFRQINDEDSRVWLRFKEGLIKKGEIINQIDKNIITAALGLKENIQPHYYSGILKDYFQFILCSDGLTDFVTDGDVEKSLSEDKSVRDKSIDLVNKALNNNSDDDISVIVVEGEISKKDIFQ